MFTIATYNTNSIRARLHIIKKYIEDIHPDCLCLQETKVVDEQFPKEFFLEQKYNVIFKGQKAYNGVAIASPHKIENVIFGFEDGEDREEDLTRLIRCKIKGISIINSYVPQGRDIEHEQYQIKLNWFKRLKRLFEQKYKKELPIIWCGDMNVAPTELDVYEPEKKLDHVCFHEAVRRAFLDVVSWGFIDIFRKFHPEPEQFSFFDYRIRGAVKRKLGWRIDHILVTKNLADKAIDAKIDLKYRLLQKPSDHTFVRALFDL